MITNEKTTDIANKIVHFYYPEQSKAVKFYVDTIAFHCQQAS